MPRDIDLLAGANVVDIDTAGSTYEYYGFVRSDKSCIIMRNRVDGTQILYALARDYDVAWANRASLNYKRPDQYNII